MFKTNPFLSPSILPTNTKWYDIENKGQGHYPLNDHWKLLYEPLVIHYKY